MHLRFNSVVHPFTRHTAPTALQAATRPSCQPQPPPDQAVVEDQRPQVTVATPKRFRWTIGGAGVLVLLAGTLAAKRITFYHPPVVASYNTRLAELDTKLSRALASQLRAAGFEFDAAIVNVEGPSCQRAVCLLKGVRIPESLFSFPAKVSAQHDGNGTWKFEGMDWLAALKFSVDASSELQRLAESTPPGFAQAVVSAAPLRSGHQVVSPFDREFEISLSALTDGGRGRWLDLETGRCMTEPDWEYFGNSRTCSHWLRTNSLDLSAVASSDGSYWLSSRHLAVVPVDRGLWLAGTPSDLMSHRALRSAPTPAQAVISPEDDQADTYLFRTKEGALGILRLLEFNPASRQLRVQYKVAQPGAEADI